MAALPLSPLPHKGSVLLPTNVTLTRARDRCSRPSKRVVWLVSTELLRIGVNATCVATPPAIFDLQGSSCVDDPPIFWQVFYFFSISYNYSPWDTWILKTTHPDCTISSGVLGAGFVSCKKKNRNAKNMASAGARAYMGVWGRCPQRGPGAEHFTAEESKFVTLI